MPVTANQSQIFYSIFAGIQYYCPHSDQTGNAALQQSDEKPKKRRYFMALAAFIVSGACNSGDQAAAARVDAAAASVRPAPDSTLSPCGAGAGFSMTLTGTLSGSVGMQGLMRLACDSMLRPDNNGVRLRFARDVLDERFVVIIGIPSLKPGETRDGLPSNLTITVEGSGRFFSTSDLDVCWTDIHRQNRLDGERYTVGGEVHCIAPLTEMNGDGVITVTDFAFRGIVDWGAE